VQKIVAALTEQHRELDALLGPLTDEGWATPTPRCPGWTVSDVVLHLAQTNEMALGSATGQFSGALARLTDGIAAAGSVDEGADALVAAERGAEPAELLGRWSSGAAALRETLGGLEPGRRVQWVVGEMAARTLATTRLAETWIHTGDVLNALGRPVVASDRIRHIARLAWRTLPYAFATAGRTLAGPVQLDLTGPNGEPWTFGSDEPAATTITGTALDLCQVAGQRALAVETGLVGTGPDAADVLSLVRTFA
jgi:uncharacterized protein (TIGR03084 family)